MLYITITEKQGEIVDGGCLVIIVLIFTEFLWIYFAAIILEILYPLLFGIPAPRNVVDTVSMSCGVTAFIVAIFIAWRVHQFNK